MVVAVLAVAGCGGSSGGRCTTSDDCAATAYCISGACVDGCRADLVAPAGASVALDGTTVPLTVVGGTSWGAATASVAPGLHAVTASAPCGVQVYGAGNAVAYAYPAGLSLATLP